MKTLSLLALAAGCSSEGSNLGNTPILGAPAWTSSFSANPGFVLPYNGEGGTNGGVAFEPNGDVVIAAYYSGTVAFGDAPPTESRGIFLSRRARLDGREVWTQTFTPTNDFCSIAALQVDTAGNAYVAGYSESGVDFGSIKLAQEDGTAYVAKYSSGGTLLWARAYGGSTSLDAGTLTLMPDGNLVITGHPGLYPMPETLPSGKTQTCMANEPCNDWFMELDASGNVLRDAFVPAYISRIASLGDGTLQVAGRFPSQGPNSEQPILVALAADGSVLQTTQIAWPPTTYYPHAIVPTDDGLVVAAGGSSGSTVPYLNHYDPTNALTWSDTTTGTASLQALARTPDGSLVGVGSMASDTVDFGHGPVAGKTFLASYRADGTFVDARVFDDGTPADVDLGHLAAVAVADDGAVAYAGVFDAPIDFGSGPIDIPESSAAFVFGLIAPPIP